MSAGLPQIKDYVHNLFFEATTIASNYFSVPTEEVDALWDPILDKLDQAKYGDIVSEQIVKDKPKKKEQQTVMSEMKNLELSDPELVTPHFDVKSKVKITFDSVICQANLKSGPRRGQPCGKKVSKKSVTELYCAQHLKLETNPAVPEADEPLKKSYIFTKDKDGNFVHEATGLVVSVDKIIVGKQKKTGEIVLLSNDDIEQCNKYRFVYDKTKIA
jgi:hypothetical protein